MINNVFWVIKIYAPIGIPYHDPLNEFFEKSAIGTKKTEVEELCKYGKNMSNNLFWASLGHQEEKSAYQGGVTSYVTFYVPTLSHTTNAILVSA